MTRERFEMIQREFKQAIVYQPPITVNAPLLLWGEMIKALEEAWAELEKTIRARDGAERRVKVLEEQVAALKLGYRGFP